MADRIGVMYLGKLVEIGTGDDIYERPAHPYTAGLLAAIPVPNPEIAREQSGRSAVTGELPSPARPAVRLPLPHPLPAARRRSAPPRSRRAAPVRRRALAACHFPLQTPA